MMVKTLTVVAATDLLSHAELFREAVEEATERTRQVADLLEIIEESIKEEDDEVHM
ncbi:MAG: hypothetical protein ACXABY_36170 [Candidatus Thorarchaeota archaeon]